jgi:murein DD-endopeptidase MepM/ murein hydrolase activator NlpD
MQVIDGLPWIAQRFAIDWIRLGPDGLAFHGDPKKNESWVGYGSELLAVADGTVSGTKDGIPQNVPLTEERAVPITLDTITGNYVVLDLGDGRFAVYAHLQPGSLYVKVGDPVRKGQLLGLLGNSGNSDAPHLHFHLMDASAPMVAEGLPYVFPDLTIQGRADSADDLLAGKPWKPARAEERRTVEIPLENEVVRFPLPSL